ncbi:MAG: DUF6240 domain-containing protein [Lachnospiraceae bacterium]|nr:DUF6240 domain-containing protein [Lachnospiraceae bacterium]
MKITIDASENGASSLGAVSTGNTAANVDNSVARTTSASAKNAGTTKYNPRIDISSNVMDNNAYSGHGKTAEDVMQEAGSQDIVARRNYMAIMSNTMSKEDFAKLLKDGTHPGNTEIGTVVTIIDHIKAALIKGGKEIHGFTDNLDAEKFAAITGNKVMAQKLANQFNEKNLPPTGENLSAAGKAWDKAREITALSEGAVKYMVENQLPPTIENLYLARFSGGNDAGKQGRGYFAQDIKAADLNQPVYFAKKADNFDWDKLEPQIEKVIKEAGYEINEENLANGRWLIEKGIPLTTNNFIALKQLQEFKLPPDSPSFIEAKATEISAAITAAIADGRNPLTANLLDGLSYAEKAVQYIEDIKDIEPPAIEKVVSGEQIINLKNLLAAQKQILREKMGKEVIDRPSQSMNAIQPTHLPQTTVPQTAAHQTAIPQTAGNAQPNFAEKALAAQRLLAETSLIMTAAVNLRMLRTGFNIETAPLEKLVSELKNAEKAIQNQLIGGDEEAITAKRYFNYNETVTKIGEISAMPADLVGRMVRFVPVNLVPKALATLNEIHTNGAALKTVYEKAGENYEQVMTAPRRDMGDSIHKAFRNVDDILAELNLNPTDANRRAVRILGYNSMEINHENIEAVKEKDTQLQDILAKMKPGTVLEMIREGLNPLAMSLDELENILNGRNEAITETLDNYSHFLAKLDKKGNITSTERSVYIGVYRLLRQIEKGESRAIGSLLNAEMDFSLGNLLTAMRSNRRQGMDYNVNDDFGGVDAVTNDDSLEVSLNKLHQALQNNGSNKTEAGLQEKLRDIIDKLDLDETNEEYLAGQIKNIKSLNDVGNEIIQSLLDSNQQVTVNNLLAAFQMTKKPGEMHQKARELADKTDLEAVLAEAKESLIRDFTDEDNATAAYENLQKAMNGIFSRAADSEQATALDVRELSNMCRQISLQAAMKTSNKSEGYREERYDIPIEIDGEITAINLLLRHNSESEGKVSCAMNTTAFGAVTAEFDVNNEKLQGHVAVNNSEGLKKLSSQADNLYTALNEIIAGDKIIGDIHFIKSNKTYTNLLSNAETNSNKSSMDEQEKSKDAKNKDVSKVSNKELYLTAKAFITFIQKLGKED